MKKIAIIVSTLAFCLAMVSCGEKCTTCSYSFEANGETITQPWPQECGSKSEVDLYKEGLQSLADLAAIAGGGTTATVTCVDD